jgi:hypothetical protein
MQKSTAKPETITIRHLAATLADGHGLPKSKMNDMLAGMVDPGRQGRIRLPAFVASMRATW